MLQNKLNALGWDKTTLNRKWTLFTSIVQPDYLGDKTSEIAQNLISVNHLLAGEDIYIDVKEIPFIEIPQILDNLGFVFDIRGILFSAKNKGQSTQTYPDQNNIDCAVYEIGISHKRNATDNH